MPAGVAISPARYSLPDPRGRSAHRLTLPDGGSIRPGQSPGVMIRHGRLRFGGGVEFGRDAGGLGRANPLEYLQGLPQEGLGLRGVAGGQGAAAQAGQRASLGRGADVGAGLFQGLLVALLEPARGRRWPGAASLSR